MFVLQPVSFSYLCRTFDFRFYIMISVDGLTVEFGDRALFKDISFQINEKDRIALMGKNGAGKSTLLKILAGARKPTRGNVTAPKDTVIAYLPQHLMTEDGRTVYEEASQAFPTCLKWKKNRGPEPPIDGKDRLRFAGILQTDRRSFGPQ